MRRGLPAGRHRCRSCRCSTRTSRSGSGNGWAARLSRPSSPTGRRRWTERRPSPSCRFPGRGRRTQGGVPFSWLLPSPSRPPNPMHFPLSGRRLPELLEPLPDHPARNTCGARDEGNAARSQGVGFGSSDQTAQPLVEMRLEQLEALRDSRLAVYHL